MLLHATQIRLRTGTLSSSLLGGCWEWCGQQPSALQELHHLMESRSSGLLHFRNSQYPVIGHLGSLPKLNDLVNFRGLGRLLRSLSWLHKTYLLYLPDLIDWLIDFWLLWVFLAMHRLFLVVAGGGCSLVGMLRLLIALASLVTELRL